MNNRKRKKLLVWLVGFLCVLLSVYSLKQLHAYYVTEQLRAKLRTGEYVVYLGDFNVEDFLRRNKPEVDPFNNQDDGQDMSETGLGRQLPDTRPHLCRSFHTATHLSQTSVILVYQDINRATLLKTIYSVLLKSPPELIGEIILVDDNSADVRTGELLSLLPKVRIIKNEKKEGWIQSSNIASSLATYPVLTFIHAECEVNIGWLQPMLHRLSQLPNAVVSPVLDKIDATTGEYTPSELWRKGGFDWNLTFKWEKISVGPSQNKVIRSPVFGGHVFSMGRERFINLGKFDPGMEMRGGENLELSFKTWLCGGVVEIMPCSRVGQVNLEVEIVGVPEGKENLYLKNIKRVAEVWMDDYKRFFYYTKPSGRMINSGSVMERKILRRHLKCSSFKWYMDNVYPELRLPVTDEVLYGKIQQSSACIDIDVGHVPAIAKLGPCSEDKGTQDWSFKKTGEITNGGMCLTSDPVETHGYVMVHFCTKDKSQKWHYENGLIYRDGTSHCIDSHKADVGLVISDCDEMYDSQKWSFASKAESSRTKDEV